MKCKEPKNFCSFKLFEIIPQDYSIVRFCANAKLTRESGNSSVIGSMACRCKSYRQAREEAGNPRNIHKTG
jgi:hypothetical protein